MNNIHSWADFKRIFVGNFQGMYVGPQIPGISRPTNRKLETLREYIRCFSKQCNDLPDIMHVDVIGAFIFCMTNKALVHEHGHYKPRMT